MAIKKELLQIFIKIERDIACLKKPIILGVNGVDTSGKSIFSENFQRYLKSKGHHTLLIHIDDFHNPRLIRSKDDSPQGYLDNAFDLSKIAIIL
jgi:Predicted kinase